MTIDDFMERLEDVKRGGGGYMARCPAHDDGTRSLSIKEGEEGVLIHCHAGCQTPDIVATMGLRMADLYYVQRTNHAEPEAIYQYRDAQGNDVYQALRFPGKKFKQRHEDPDGEWIWSLKDVDRVLYRLPELIAAVSAGRPIFICEGEKDVEAIVAAGWDATCNPMGAGKWRPEFNAHFAGADVAIIQDRDEPGRVHALTIKNALLESAKSVIILQSKSGKDASDHLAAGHTIEELVEPRQKPVSGLYSAHDLYEAAKERLTYTEEDLPSYDPLSDLARNLSFREGRIYVLGGYTGDGKTSLALQATRRMCESEKAPTIFYGSNEMTNVDLTNKLLEHQGIPMKVLDSPWLIPGSMYEDIYMQAIEEIGSWNLTIKYKPRMTADEIVQHTIDLEADFVIVDHVHRFAWGGERRTLEEQLMKLTDLALEHNIPVLVLAQLRRFTRGKDMENYPRPMLQDFRETEAFGNEAARAMAIWRQREPNGITYMPSGGSELIVLKDRFGPLSSPLIKFDGPRQLFVPLSMAIEPETKGIWGS